ncbi:cytochrome c biogenesis protein CcsA [Bacillaceae bacterium SIJ1]|uniref:cytochrome C assembly family protein n=1 Tax=Litoribacterium kuwaitense TaxID=1398745 RepID=UPI0013EAE7A2|nr:cytochrome c biogenesis protein CcsA [Litoribacterium kuwaitense]NGP45504.1 cytochrome c biogenesis protein CcsA [Litoribacterium kuwaitense]
MVAPQVSVLFDAAVILYALSILFYFIDFIQNNRKANHVAFWLLAIVWVLQTGFLILKMIDLGRFPVLSMFEGLYFYTWLLVTLSLVVNRIFRVDFFLFFTNIVAFSLLVLHLFSPDQYPSVAMSEKVTSELSLLHIAMAFISYGTFTLSFVFSLLYWLQYELLKKRKWGPKLQRLGDLSQLERLSFLFAVMGVPFLFISLILGTFWAILTVEAFRWYDPKVIGSFVVLGAYSLLIYFRVSNRMYGRLTIQWTMICFFVLLINFFLLGSLPTFHIWST